MNAGLVAVHPPVMARVEVEQVTSTDRELITLAGAARHPARHAYSCLMYLAGISPGDRLGVFGLAPSGLEDPSPGVKLPIVTTSRCGADALCSHDIGKNIVVVRSHKFDGGDRRYSI